MLIPCQDLNKYLIGDSKMYIDWNGVKDDNRIVYIYAIINKEDRIAYVGQTMNVDRRIKEHFEKSDSPIVEDLKWFGVEAFEVKILDKCFYKHRNIVERWWTEKVGKKYALYNIMMGANHVYSTKKRLSEVTRGKNNGMYGKSGKNAINGNKVKAIDENGNVVKTFASIGMACKFCKTKGHSQLYDAIRNNKQYKGYYWTCERDIFK